MKHEHSSSWTIVVAKGWIFRNMNLTKKISRDLTSALINIRSNGRTTIYFVFVLICLILMVTLHTQHMRHDATVAARAAMVNHGMEQVASGKRVYDNVTVSDCLSRMPATQGRTFETRVRGVRVSFAGWTANETFDRQAIALRTHEAVRIMSKFERAATLLDIGANVGKVTFPVLAMRAVHTVVAVEPVKKNMNMMCVTANLNGWLGRPGLLLLEAAMSDKKDQVQIFVPKGREDNSAINRKAATANVHEHEVRETVHTLVADEVLEQGGFTPDVIKIDTQGHELHVLRGLKRYLMKAESGAVLVMAESDPKLMNISGVDPMQIYDLMVEELDYDPYCKPNVEVVRERLKVTGHILTKGEYPPGGCRDIIYFKQTT